MKPMIWISLLVGAIALTAGFLSNNMWLGVVSGFILIAAIWAWYFHKDERSERSQGLAAALSVLALLFGVYWYMIERPGAAKLNLLLQAQAFRADPGRALIFLSVEVQNVGNTPVSFEGEKQREEKEGDAQLPISPYNAAVRPPPPTDVDCLPESREAGNIARETSVMKIRVGKVAPLTEGLRQRLACATASSPTAGQVPLARADLWPPVAWADQTLVTKIEAGETEKYYYRALVPCEKSLVVAATARIPKRGTITDALIQRESPGLVWIGQTIIDLSEVCGK